MENNMGNNMACQYVCGSIDYEKRLSHLEKIPNQLERKADDRWNHCLGPISPEGGLVEVIKLSDVSHTNCTMESLYDMLIYDTFYSKPLKDDYYVCPL